jgi:poly-beta-1,6-N-acetyl-D-glucosamine synthase
MVVALIPAHNEELTIVAAIESVQDQVDRVIVIADNCTDRTVEVAAATCAEVIETVGNTDKKAGALNQVLDGLLPTLSDEDLVFVLDADGTIDPGFIDAAEERFDRDLKLGGVSGTFRGAPGGGFVGTMQRNEYARYARDVRRLKGRALVLTGTAAVFRAETLRDVVKGRHENRLPYGAGKVYDTGVLTEDNELTLALMHMRWKILAPRECTLTTEVMETWGELGKQRLRWKRGAFENLWDYGLTRITAAYWGRQALSLVSVLATLAYMVSVLATVALGMFTVQPLWLAVTGVFVLERVVTVHTRGWRQMLVACPLVIEMVFDLFLQIVQARAFAQVALRRKAAW